MGYESFVFTFSETFWQNLFLQIFWDSHTNFSLEISFFSCTTYSLFPWHTNWNQDRRQLLMFQKDESDGGSFFNVVLECQKRWSELFRPNFGSTDAPFTWQLIYMMEHSLDSITWLLKIMTNRCMINIWMKSKQFSWEACNGHENFLRRRIVPLLC